MATKTTTPSPPATLTCSSHCAAVAHPTGGSPIQAAKGPGLRPVRRQGNPIPMSVATACRNGECVAGGRRAQSQSAFIARDERAAATIGCNFHARGPRGRAVHAGARRHDWQQAPLLAKTAGEPIARWDGNRPDCEKLFKIANVPSAAAAALTLGDAATKRLACDDTPDNLKWGKPCNARRWKGDIGGGIRCTRIRCSRIPCSRIPCSRIPCSRIRCSRIPCSRIPCSRIRCSRIRCCRIPCSRIRCSRISCSRIPCSRIQLEIVDHHTIAPCAIDRRVATDVQGNNAILGERFVVVGNQVAAARCENEEDEGDLANNG
jgi:hypothetical protein